MKYITLIVALVLTTSFVAAEESNEQRSHRPITPMIFSAVGISAIVYYWGKTDPEGLRDNYLLCTAVVAAAPMGVNKNKLYLLSLTLALAAMNNYYAKHSENLEDEAGLANVAGLWVGGALLGLALGNHKKYRNDQASAVIPYVSPNGGGLVYTRLF